MQESQPDRMAAGIAAARAEVEGGVYGREESDGGEASDGRPYLLRRELRFPFPQLRDDTGAIRLRRKRRVSASFSAIRPLARCDRVLRRPGDRH
jgi:hypothetical protein